MTIGRLKSGSYRIRQMVKGKVYTVVIDHKPSDKEAHLLIAEKLNQAPIISPSMPLRTACDGYIDAKYNILSPSTIKGYRGQIKAISETLLNTPINMLTTPMIQQEINMFSVDHSPKTTSNQYGFIVSVLKFYGISLGSVSLPQKKKMQAYIPTEEEVHNIFAEIKGTVYEVPILLSAMGLRRSEICALTPEDLEGNKLTIDKAKVQNEKKEWVIKSTKTTDSTRTVIIPDYVAQLIKQQGYVYEGFPGSILRHLNRVQKKLGIQHFSLHKMRHFFASYMHKLGYTDKQIQEAGGWKTDGVMKTVYQHAMDMDDAKKKMSVNIGSLI